MFGRMLEITQDQRHLSIYRGFLCISSQGLPGQELGRVALDDLGALICAAHGTTFTAQVLVELAQRGIPFVPTARNMSPIAMLLPLDAHSTQTQRIAGQAQATKPTQKRLWQTLVARKLQMQAALLAHIGTPSAALERLAKQVRPGDEGNLEGQGARIYWPLLLGTNFRRNRDADGVNAQLNYGYTVLRSCVARAVMGAGLHPSLGINHSNRYNALCLVDDLMEPFRPFVDARVFALQQGQAQSDHAETKTADAFLTPEIKAFLVATLQQDLTQAHEVSPLSTVVQNMAWALAKVYLGERRDLELPQTPKPRDLYGFCIERTAPLME